MINIAPSVTGPDDGDGVSRGLVVDNDIQLRAGDLAGSDVVLIPLATHYRRSFKDSAIHGHHRHLTFRRNNHKGTLLTGVDLLTICDASNHRIRIVRQIDLDLAYLLSGRNDQRASDILDGVVAVALVDDIHRLAGPIRALTLTPLLLITTAS
mgnify:CR=1 FL=1